MPPIVIANSESEIAEQPFAVGFSHELQYRRSFDVTSTGPLPVVNLTRKQAKTLLNRQKLLIQGISRDYYCKKFQF